MIYTWAITAAVVLLFILVACGCYGLGFDAGYQEGYQTADKDNDDLSDQIWAELRDRRRGND